MLCGCRETANKTYSSNSENSDKQANQTIKNNEVKDSTSIKFLTSFQKDIIEYAPKFLVELYGQENYLKLVEPLWHKYGSPIELKKHGSLRAEGLYHEFISNVVKADLKYKDQWIKISGSVEEIGKSPVGTIFIRLKLRDFEKKIIIFGFEDSIQLVARLSIGDRVFLVGKCRGLILGELNFINGEVDKRNYEAVSILDKLEKQAKDRNYKRYSELKKSFYKECFDNHIKLMGITENNINQEKVRQSEIFSINVKRTIDEILIESAKDKSVFLDELPENEQVKFRMISFFRSFKEDTFAAILYSAIEQNIPNTKVYEELLFIPFFDNI